MTSTLSLYYHYYWIGDTGFFIIRRTINARDVANGDYLVYSIRDKDNNRYSTLGIRKDRYNKWVFDQCYKYRNKQVNNDDVKELPKIIIEQLNKENK